MLAHEQKTARIIEQLKNRKSNKPVSLKKKAVSHEVPKPGDKRHGDEKIDVSDLTDIISVDAEKRLCVAEPGVTFVDLVTETMKHGLVPIIVPELKTITIGGAIAGCSIESMSYKYGGFHDTCTELEVITAKGEVLTATRDNEHKLIFNMVHGTFGTLGIITKLTFKLVPAKPYVHVTYEKYDKLDDYKAAIWKRYTDKDVDFMDGIIHSPTEYVLSLGNFADEAPYAHNYDWTRVYYKSTSTRKEDFMKTPDYFFRYDKGVTNVNPSSFLGRLFLGKFINSNNVLAFANKFHKLIPDKKIPITVDTFIPFSRINEFLAWYEREVGHYALWCVPYKLVNKYPWIADDFLEKTNDELFLDIAVYGMPRKDDKNYYRMIEEKLMEIGGLKTLISTNYYSEEEFWRLWNKDNYRAAKAATDPDNIFRDLYQKTCRTMRGLD